MVRLPVSVHGSRAVVRVFGALATPGLLAVALAPNLPLAAIAMFLFGGAIGGMDVAMNANGVVVEKRLSRAIMSSLHGFWSLGGFAGGALGGFAIQRFGHLSHAAAVTLAVAAIALIALPKLYPDERPATRVKPKVGLPRHATVYLVGLMALFSMIPEGAVLDWAALYLQQELGADLATAGLAFGCFAGAMAAVRFLGDRVRNRFGAVATLRASSVVAAQSVTSPMRSSVICSNSRMSASSSMTSTWFVDASI